MTAPLDHALAQWVGLVGGLSDTEYRRRVLTGISEASRALYELPDEGDRAQVLEDQAALVHEWLRLIEEEAAA